MAKGSAAMGVMIMGIAAAGLAALLMTRKNVDSNKPGSTAEANAAAAAQDPDFWNSLNQTSTMQLATSLTNQGLNNAQVVDAALAAMNQTPTPRAATPSPVQTATPSAPGTKKTAAIGSKTFTSYFSAGSKQIANKSGKNYANVGAGTDPSKW